MYNMNIKKYSFSEVLYLFILLNTVIWHGLYDVISVFPEH